MVVHHLQHVFDAQIVFWLEIAEKSLKKYSRRPEVHVVRQPQVVGDEEAVHGADECEHDQRDRTLPGPLPEGPDEQRRHRKQFRVDAHVVRVRQTHVLKAKVVVDEEHVAPPVLLANVPVPGDDQVPLGATAEEGEHERAEQDERSQGWSYPKKATDVVLVEFDPLATHPTTHERVGGEEAAEHDERVGEDGCCPADHGPRLTEGLRWVRKTRKEMLRDPP